MNRDELVEWIEAALEKRDALLAQWCVPHFECVPGPSVTELDFAAQADCSCGARLDTLLILEMVTRERRRKNAISAA